MTKSMTQTPVEYQVKGSKTSAGWAKILNDLIRDLRLSAFEFRLFCALDARQGSKPSQVLKLETLAKDLGVSKRTVSRGLKRLQELGLLDVQLRLYESRYYLKNPSRSHTPMTPMSHPHDTHVMTSYKELSYKEPKQEQPSPTLAVVAVEGELTNKTYTETALKVITAETGVKVALNEKTLKACSRALKLGFDSPHSYGLEVAKHYKSEATKKTIKSPSGFLVSVSMVAILEGETIQENKPTPIPPRYNSNQLETLCPTHGDEGFLINACPPCRQLNREQENLLSVVSL